MYNILKTTEIKTLVNFAKLKKCYNTKKANKMTLTKYISKVTKEFKDIRVVRKTENLLKKILEKKDNKVMVC